MHCQYSPCIVNNAAELVCALPAERSCDAKLHTPWQKKSMQWASARPASSQTHANTRQHQECNNGPAAPPLPPKGSSPPFPPLGHPHVVACQLQWTFRSPPSFYYNYSHCLSATTCCCHCCWSTTLPILLSTHLTLLSSSPPSRPSPLRPI